jgi:hypothetical protein
VASVRRCIDCDVVLVDQERGGGELVAPSSATPVGTGDEVAYELDGWSNQLKLSLEGMLDREGIRRVWEAAVLVVPAEFEEQVDGLIATVEGAELDELVADGVQVAFELHELTTDELEDLDARLYAAGVVHAWTEEAELLVAEDAADEVEAMIDAVINPSDEVGDDGDGLALQERLSSLYVAVDKLVKDPLDAKPVARFATAAAGIGDLGVPYGLAGGEWASLLELIDDLSAVTGGGAAGDVDLEAIDQRQRPLDAEGEPLDDDELDEVEAAVDRSGDEAAAPVIDRHGLARDLALELRERLRELV